MSTQELKYKGIGGDEGLKRFKVETKRAETQILLIVDFIIRNKEVVSDFDKSTIASFFEAQTLRLHSEGINSLK